MAIPLKYYARSNTAILQCSIAGRAQPDAAERFQMPGFTSTGLVDALPIADGNGTGTVNNSIDAACTIEQLANAVCCQRVKQFLTFQVSARSDASTRTGFVLLLPPGTRKYTSRCTDCSVRLRADRSVRLPEGRGIVAGSSIARAAETGWQMRRVQP